MHTAYQAKDNGAQRTVEQNEEGFEYTCGLCTSYAKPERASYKSEHCTSTDGEIIFGKCNLNLCK